MNTTIFAAFLGGWEIILILAVVLILFGAKKLPELAKGLGQGIKEFKKASSDVQRDLQSALEEDHTPPPPAQPKNLPAANPQTADSSPSSTPKA